MGRLAEMQKKLLEQIMGAEAMGMVEVDISIYDPKLCKAFLTGICPHDLFTNTKMDLGSCPRTHSIKTKNQYEALLAQATEANDATIIGQLNRLRVEYENSSHQFVEECDRRIRAAQRRLEKTPEENNRTTALMREIGELEGAYQAAMADVELLGSAGQVEESMSQLTKAEALKAEKVDKERELQQLTENSGASGHQKLRVCDVCGAYLSVLDSDKRLADHFSGKLHLGYYKMREMIKEWNARGHLPVVAGMAVPLTAAPVEAAPAVVVSAPLPTTFRPIPASKLLVNTRAQPPASAPSGPADRNADPRDRSERSRDHRESRDSRDSRGGEREKSSRRDREGSGEGERKSSSSRRDGEHHTSSRSSRRDDEDRHRDDDRDRHRSSRRDGDDQDRERSSRSSRGKEHESESRSGEKSSRSSRREETEDGEMPERGEKEKRRRLD